MKKLALIIFLLSFGIPAIAQSEKNKTPLKMAQISTKQFYSTKTKGWVLLESDGGEQHLANLSNKDYFLYLNINCKDQSQKPSFLIEYNNNYRDHEWAGLDFASSQLDQFKKTVFLVDQKEFANPFVNYSQKPFEGFKNALKKGKVLTMKFYDKESNLETGKEYWKLNREITFMLYNPELLEISGDCRAEDDTEVESSEAINV